MTPNEQQIRWLRKRLPKYVEEILELVPRAYCVAKPAPLCAVFVMPPQDLRKHLRAPELAKYHNAGIFYDGIEDVNPGDWRTLVYACWRGASIWYCVEYMPVHMIGESK